MPAFPVHSYGTQEFARFFMPAMQSKWGAQEREKQKSEDWAMQLALTQAQTGKFNPDLETWDRFTPIQREALSGISQAAREAQMQKIEESNLTRQMKAFDKAISGANTYFKMIDKGDLSPEHAKNLRNVINKFFNLATGTKDEEYIPGNLDVTDSKEATKKKLWNRMQGTMTDFNETHTEIGLNRIEGFAARLRKFASKDENNLLDTILSDARETWKRVSTKGKVPSTIETFELQYYGKPVPELRGTPEYVKKLTEAKKAGAISITQHIGAEKFGIQKGVTAGKVRTELINNKDNKKFYEANVSTFNTVNTRNEIAYWDTKEKWYGDEETKIVRLPVTLIQKGLTPKKIQEMANREGKTIKEILIDLGIVR